MLIQVLVIGCFILLWILCAAVNILVVSSVEKRESRHLIPMSKLKLFVLATILVTLAPVFLIIAIFDFFMDFVKT